MTLHKIEAAWIDPAAIVAIVPDQPDTVHGVVVREAEPNRCKLLLRGNFRIAVDMSADDLAARVGEWEAGL